MMKSSRIVLIFVLLFSSWTLFAEQEAGYMDLPLQDIMSQEQFSLSDFAGRKVLLQTFAVWCSKCKRQQIQLAELREEVGDDVVIISLDVDPNESVETVRTHISENGYDWYVAIAPPDFTQLLMQSFGSVVVVAPAVPMILINEDGETRLLRRGVKSVSKLKRELEEG
jgi:thiol-disulfide isomerase/thioredoxin